MAYVYYKKSGRAGDYRVVKFSTYWRVEIWDNVAYNDWIYYHHCWSFNEAISACDRFAMKGW